ncbi:ATPase, T2SS/T4P/T4SS family [Streptomyces sp. ADI95-17]|uniref:CpaF family protein n=1 Tax=Streptomyces sp. ADI95-17 TaxID=1522759 RepID=UPI000F5B97B7|nr:ATPase, T2SS/T4P/T4SS family [Streptomyces sp. ADI95-17]RPK55813.1 Type IV secretion system protein PtlH [Streptomyces sp. ADI95-17]
MAERRGKNGGPVNGAAPSTTLLGSLLADPSRTAPQGLAGQVFSQAAPAVPQHPAASAATAGPSDVSTAASLPGALPVPQEKISELRQKVADDVDNIKKERRAKGETLDTAALEQVVRTQIRVRVAEWAQEWSYENTPLTSEQITVLRGELFNLFFLAGALQQVLERPGVEDVLIDGRWMYVDARGQQRQRLRSPFTSDEQALEWVNQMAAMSGHGERLLSYATGKVDFDLPDGSRVAATMLTEPHLVISIRRHLLEKATLDELVKWGSIDTLLLAFLRAAVRAGLSIIIAGDMASGKTTLMRALGREVPAKERLATLEGEPELRLNYDEYGQHAHTIAFRSREGNGEKGAAGRVTLGELVETSLRYRATRVMVGEVRGTEAVAMLKAMMAGGAGSMCTLHAKDPESVVDRLMVPLTEGGLSDSSAYRLIAAAVDLIVYVDRVDETDIGGGEHRFVTHVWETAGLSERAGVALTHLFAPNEELGEVRAVPTTSAMDGRRAKKLARHGFLVPWRRQRPHGTWEPLKLVDGDGMGMVS